MENSNIPVNYKKDKQYKTAKSVAFTLKRKAAK